METKHKLIAFTGYGGAGKDEAAKTLLEYGYKRFCFGDLIKARVDEAVKKKYGFSAFTEKPAEKKKIRNLLEQEGEKHYDEIFEQFFKELPALCINVRLCRLREAQEWIKRGGILVAVVRPGLKPETDWARERFEELRKAGVIYAYLLNDGKPEALPRKVKSLFELDGAPVVSQAPLPSTPKLATPVSAPSAVGARVDEKQGPTTPPSVATAPVPAGAAPHAEGPKDQDGLDEFVADSGK